jgi:hypothetical protein
LVTRTLAPSGRLDDIVPATLVIRARDRAQLTARIALAELSGDHDFRPDVAGDLRDPALVIEVRYDGEESTGTLTLVETVANGGDPRSIVVGSWSPAR